MSVCSVDRRLHGSRQAAHTRSDPFLELLVLEYIDKGVAATVTEYSHHTEVVEGAV